MLCNLCSRLWDLWEKMYERLIISCENDCPVLWNILVRVVFIFMFCRSLSLSMYSNVELIVMLQVCNLMFHPPVGKYLTYVCRDFHVCMQHIMLFAKLFFFPLDFFNFCVQMFIYGEL